MVTYHILLYQFILLRFCDLCLESSNLISVYWVYFRTCLILGNPSPLMDLWKGGFVLIPTMYPRLCIRCPSYKIQPRWKVDQNLMRRSILRLQSFLFHIPCGWNLISVHQHRRPSIKALCFPMPILSLLLPSKMITILILALVSNSIWATPIPKIDGDFANQLFALEKKHDKRIEENVKVNVKSVQKCYFL